MPSDNALHTAAKDGNVAEVQAQVGKFDINAKGECGFTALNWAAYEGKTEVVKLLLTLNPAPDVNLPDVSTPTMMSVHLMDISSFHISILHISSYPSRHVLLSRVVDVPPSTTQHDIQYYFFLSSFCPFPSYQYYLHYGSPVFLYYLDTHPLTHTTYTPPPSHTPLLSHTLTHPSTSPHT